MSYKPHKLKFIFFKKISRIFFGIILLQCPFFASAFSCISPAGVVPGSGGQNYTVSFGVNLSPQVGVNQNLVVDLSSSIRCANQSNSPFQDILSAEAGSSFSNGLASFSGTLNYYGNSYAFPLQGATSFAMPGPPFSFQYYPWQAKLYLTPILTNSAGGVVIKTGEYFASIRLRKRNIVYSTGAQTVPDDTYTWNLYALNDVVVPIGGCDVSSRNIIVQLPDYPGGATPVGLTVNCPSGNKNLAYYLTGTTTNAANGNNIFSNTAGSSPAQGVGVQISNANGVIVAGSNVSLGIVGTSAVNLGLTANYATTGGQVIAGNVQSIIGVTFIYQ